MRKAISVSEMAYEALKKRKRPNESFSDVVMRLAGQADKRSLLEFAGTWKGSDIDKVFLDVMKDREHLVSGKVESEGNSDASDGIFSSERASAQE
jgi:predicted CopG family antitoxin